MRIVGRSIASTLVLGISVFGALSGGCGGPKPPLPPLLQSVTAEGGWWGACPAETSEAARAREQLPMALSPELQERLVQKFPPGSDEKRLLKSLQEQGFKLLPPCNGDHSVREAAFSQHGGSLLSYPLTASVFWKTDEAGNIAWTKGFVRFTGL